MPAVAAGRVILPRARDTVPVPGARVVLHRVGRAEQGPIDSVTADAAGRFRFRFRADTAVIYLLSARYGDIEYFSPPIHTNPAAPDTAMRVVVYDTSSTAPIGVEARHIVVPRAGPDGTRSVLDLIVLRNDGRLARVAPDSSRPSWRMVLPSGAGDMAVGDGDVSPDAIVRVGDTVNVLAPLSPGQKQISLEYGVTPRRGTIDFEVGPAGSPVNLLVEERDTRVSGGTLALADSQVIEGRSFRRYAGAVPAGDAVRLTIGGAAVLAATRWALPALVAALALALAAVAWALFRRARPAPPLSPEGVLDAIAALDARYAGREAEIAVAEWQRYVAERTRLKAELEGGLAAPGRSSYS
ncbi:MAG: hypothetical protein ABJC36_13620 [Gemmatimonadales bacterium]